MKKGILSFNDDEENAETDTTDTTIQRSSTPAENSNSDSTQPFKKRGLRPNATVAHQPKALTKSALLKEAQLKEALRKEYTQLQEAVKATEFVLPFVFYDGKNAPGGMCRMKKGDHIWLFLERARKVGADKADKSRRDWARISVDDLMLVKGDIIIPQVSEFPGAENRTLLTFFTARGLLPLHCQPHSRISRPLVRILLRTYICNTSASFTFIDRAEGGRCAGRLDDSRGTETTSCSGSGNWSG